MHDEKGHLQVHQLTSLEIKRRKEEFLNLIAPTEPERGTRINEPLTGLNAMAERDVWRVVAYTIGNVIDGSMSAEEAIESFRDAPAAEILNAGIDGHSAMSWEFVLKRATFELKFYVQRVNEARAPEEDDL